MAKYQPGWKLLGYTVKRRRDRLGITQEEVAEAGGPSVATLRLIENAQASEPRSKTLFALDKAIGWPRGSAIGLVEGKPPTESWTTEFDTFVDDLIDYVSDTMREKYDVPVSPRQGRFEMYAGSDAELPAAEIHIGKIDDGRLSLGTRADLVSKMLREYADTTAGGNPEQALFDVLLVATNRLTVHQIAGLRYIADAAEHMRRIEETEGTPTGLILYPPPGVEDYFDVEYPGLLIKNPGDGNLANLMRSVASAIESPENIEIPQLKPLEDGESIG